MNELLEIAVKAHGGPEVWRAIRTIEVKASLSGELLRIKGHPKILMDVSFQIKAHEPSAIVKPFGGPRSIGHFSTDRVWIEGNGDVEDNDLHSPRQSFDGHALTTPWSKLQVLYFFGYGMWNYFTTPFLFTEPGFRTREIEPHIENGETWRRLAVSYPKDIPTHCTEQVLHFSQEGLLQRLDYFVDVVNGPAAHYCYDHKNFSGIMIPTLRRVVGRTPEGSKPSGPTGVLLQFSDVTLG